jgi:hypothetical protein
MDAMNQKKVQIVGSICLVEENEVIKLVPKDVLEDIRKRDKHPMFAMMSIGNQGESKGALFEGTPGMGKKMSSWYRQLWPLKAVKKLIKHMKPNAFTPVYESHPSGDPTEQRPVVGSIVNGVKKLIDNVTHAVGIAYINNYGTRKRIERGDYNACSLEATCIFSAAENLFKYIVEDVKSLSGIALCNSEKTPTGFDDANILAVVTAMAPASDDDDDGEEEGGKKRKRSKKPMTITEIKQYIAEHKVRPDVLFTTEEMTKDAKVIDAFKSEYEKDLDEKNNEIKGLKEELEPLRKESQNTRVSSLIEKSDLLKDEHKEVVKYLQKTLSVELPAEGDSQEAVDKAVKGALETMKESGIKTKFAEKKGDTDGKNEDETGHPDTKGKDASKAKEGDMTSPENNELIPKD